MFVAYVGAMDNEVKDIIASIENPIKEIHNGYSFYLGVRGNNKIVITTSGIGKVNMAMTVTTLLTYYKVDYLINAGIAGSVDTKIGTICVANKVRYHDAYCPGYPSLPREKEYYEPSKRLLDFAKEIYKDDVLFGIFLSGDQFVDKIELLHGANLDNVVAVDMESASVGQVCSYLNTDFLIIRTVSDNLSNDDATDNEYKASNSSYNAVIKFIDNYN